MKLQRLSSKESSGEQVLDGVYRIVMDVQVTADKRITLQELHKKVAEMGSVDDIVIPFEHSIALYSEARKFNDKSNSPVFKMKGSHAMPEYLPDFKKKLYYFIKDSLNTK